MRPQASGHRRRAGIRCIDKYILLAVGGFLGFLVLVQILSQVVEEHIVDSFAARARERWDNGMHDAGQPQRAATAPTWSPASLNSVDLTRRAMRFVKTAVASADELFAMDADMAVGLLDVALLVRAKEPAAVGDVVEAFTNRALKEAVDDIAALAEAVETLDSVQAVLRVRGFSAEADICEQQRRRIVRERAVDVAAAPARAQRSFRRAPPLPAASVVAEEIEAPPRRDVSVEQLEFVLESWIATRAASGSSSSTAAERLRVAYSRATTRLVRDTFHTARTDAANYTYVSSRGAGIFYPRLCGLPAVLSRGARFHAHPSTPPASADELTSDEVLQAAEALAATCLRLYADPVVMHLEAPLQYTYASVPDKGRPPFRLVSASDGSHDTCDASLLLMRSFHELFEYTKDRVYAAWASYVMSGDAFHCPLLTTDATGSPVVRSADAGRYAATLRYFTLLFLSLECDLYRGDVGARGVCGLRTTTFVSPRHHLVSLTSGGAPVGS